MTDVSLPQAMILLALNPQRGTLRAGDKLGYVLAGAALTELTLLGRIRLDVTDRSRGPLHRSQSDVRLVDAAPTDDVACDTLLARIAAEPVRSPKQWVEKVQARLVKPTLAQVEGRGIVAAEQGTVLGFIPQTRRRVTDPSLVAGLRSAVEAVLRGGAAPTERTAALIVLADAMGLLAELVPDMTRGERKARLAQLREGQWAGVASKAAIEAAEAAAAGAVAVMAAAGTMSSS